MVATNFDGPLQVGLPALTSGASSIASLVYSRAVPITGATGSQTVVLPAGVECLDAKLYVLTAGSAAASDDIVVSAGGVNFVTFDAIGSAVGVLRATTTGLGILTTASAAATGITSTTETTLNIATTKSDAATSYHLQLIFSRVRDV